MTNAFIIKNNNLETDYNQILIKDCTLLDKVYENYVSVKYNENTINNLNEDIRTFNVDSDIFQTSYSDPTIITGFVYHELDNEPIPYASFAIYYYDSINGGAHIVGLETNASGEYYLKLNVKQFPSPQFMFVDIEKEGFNTLENYYVELTAYTINYNNFYLNSKPTAFAEGVGEYCAVAEVDEDILFIGNGFDPNGEIVLYEWDFENNGDYDWQSNSDGKVAHRYNYPGFYQAKLCVTDNDGLKDTYLVDIYIIESKDYEYSRLKINRNSDFETLKGKVEFISGSGTKTDPYIIENVKFIAKSNLLNRIALELADTSAHVIIRDCIFKQIFDDAIYTNGVKLTNAINVVVEDCVFIDIGYGVLSLEQSSCIIRNNFFAAPPIYIEDGDIIHPSVTAVYTELENDDNKDTENMFSEAFIDSNMIIGYHQGITTAENSIVIIQNNLIKPSQTGVICIGWSGKNTCFINHNEFDSSKKNKFPFWAFDGIRTKGGCNVIAEFNNFINIKDAIYCSLIDIDEYFIPNNIKINHNNFIDCTNGVTNFNDPNTIDAINNWWGSAEGPSDDWISSSCSVYGKVSYTPFLTIHCENAGLSSYDIPNTPTIQGTTEIKTNEETEYTISGTDPNNLDICYFVLWDNENIGEWIGPYSSGENVKISHTWDKDGKYNIKVISKNSENCISQWSEEFIVSSSKSKTKLFFINIFHRLIQQILPLFIT
jgi:hypothetical protein